jgi:hypothetical protein
MSKWSNRRDRQTFLEDWIIAWQHPYFRDMKPIEAYREVRRQRHGDHE